MLVLKNLNLLFEELFPFIYYWLRYRRKLNSLTSQTKIFGEDEEYGVYYKLSDDELKQRIKEEHERAKSMDDKTFKMTMSLTIAFTVLGSTANLLVKGISYDLARIAVVLSSTFSISYSLIGGFIAISSLKTLQTFGYGTKFLLDSKENKNKLVESLGSQEVMNILRHLRNESSYQCLRNGFLFLIITMLIYAISIVLSTFGVSIDCSYYTSLTIVST